MIEPTAVAGSISSNGLSYEIDSVALRSRLVQPRSRTSNVSHRYRAFVFDRCLKARPTLWASFCGALPVFFAPCSTASPPAPITSPVSRATDFESLAATSPLFRPLAATILPVLLVARTVSEAVRSTPLFNYTYGRH